MTTRFMVVPAMLLMLIAAGCAKRPATSMASAPAPGGAASLSSGTGSAPGGGSVSNTSSPSGSSAVNRAVSSTARPQPGTFRATTELKDVHFDFDKYDIRPSDTKMLDANAAWLKSNSTILVLIEGHCDERGTNEYNLALGERRAKATMNYLVSQGVAQNRVSIISYGEERPVCTDHDEACWAKNRRAHFLVKPE
ncbi:MAG: peptidoglycan-associated lipoprotein Pal [Candidatus Rokuibacteriota bacterium]|nr:MAG: peptidoglycan-associated lipoprotein Pal [Candidatus Rokubacteria bacterium]